MLQCSARDCVSSVGHLQGLLDVSAALLLLRSVRRYVPVVRYTCAEVSEQRHNRICVFPLAADARKVVEAAKTIFKAAFGGLGWALCSLQRHVTGSQSSSVVATCKTQQYAA